MVRNSSHCWIQIKHELFWKPVGQIYQKCPKPVLSNLMRFYTHYVLIIRSVLVIPVFPTLKFNLHIKFVHIIINHLIFFGILNSATLLVLWNQILLQSLNSHVLTNNSSPGIICLFEPFVARADDWWFTKIIDRN